MVGFWVVTKWVENYMANLKLLHNGFVDDEIKGKTLCFSKKTAL